MAEYEAPQAECQWCLHPVHWSWEQKAFVHVATNRAECPKEVVV
jgi:hypothetical protein